MTAKTKQITAIILMAIVAFLLIMGGVMKLIGAEPEQVMRFLNAAGFGGHIKILGITELSIAALLLYPKTNKIGFLLASCYLSGALSLELSGGVPPASALFAILLWISMLLKNREVFVVPTIARKGN